MTSEAFHKQRINALTDRVYRRIERGEENERENERERIKKVMLFVKHSWTDIQNLLRQD